MSGLEIFGWVCALVGSMAAVPQLVSIVRTRTTAGMSLLMWQLTLGINSSWTVHGVIFGYWNLIVPNVLMGLTTLVILAMMQRDRKLSLVQTFLIPVLLFAVLAGVDLGLDPVVFGALISIPQLVGAIAQFIDLVRSRDISGVSLPFLAYMVLVNALWFSWGVGTGDPALMMAASSMGVMSIINSVWWILRHTGAVRALGAKAPADGLAQVS